MEKPDTTLAIQVSQATHDNVECELANIYSVLLGKWIGVLPRATVDYVRDMCCDQSLVGMITNGGGVKEVVSDGLSEGFPEII